MVEEKDLIKECTFTVHCINGENIIHRYKVTPTVEELNKLVAVIDAVDKALAGKVPSLSFENPDIHYNIRNVVGVEFSTISKGQIEAMIKKAQERIGFKKAP